MKRVPPETFGQLLLRKRGVRGIRDVAKEIGISPATLSRIERGHPPDFRTLGKACAWLAIDPRVTELPPLFGIVN